MRLWTLSCPLCPVTVEADPEDPDAGLADLWDHLLSHPAPDARQREQLFIKAQQNAQQQKEKS